MTGKIIKGIAGFYYVLCEDGVLYECKARGVFRKDQKKPLVGDNVEIDIINKQDALGNIETILPRKNELIRPAVSNVDGALVVFSMTSPQPNLNLLDRFLIMMEQQGLTPILCFNKEDLVSNEEQEEIKRVYEKSGYQVCFASAKNGEGLDILKEGIKGKTYTIAGPSGVGKSTLINGLLDQSVMETGEISAKTERGKHTTRHSELLRVDENTFIMDTPGFTSLQVFDLQAEELKEYYPEFKEYEGQCKYLGCTHTHEPACVVKQAVEDDIISNVRYQNYEQIYRELAQKRRY